jgi:tRNA(Ile)-lysidine synthase
VIGAPVPAETGARGTPRSAESVLRIRTSVRALLTEAKQAGLLGRGELAVAVSGGQDSLALAAATSQVAARIGLRVHGLIVDHALQADSADIAAHAAAQCRSLGLDRVRVLRVTVTGTGGVEAAARKARYAALRVALPAPDSIVLLGHTRDDQAETVLLGLGRGSGPRSISGMRPLAAPWGRPLLDVPRDTTAAACAALGLTPWTDPHNSDPAFTRVRLRQEVLPLLEEVLQGGVRDALARTATQLREDTVALDVLAERLRGMALADGGSRIEVAALADEPAALRRRVLRTWLLDQDVPELTDAHLRAVDALIGEWRGQRGVSLPGGLVAHRAHGRLHVEPARSTTSPPGTAQPPPSAAG